MVITILGQVGLCSEEWQMGMSLEGRQEAAFVVSDSEASASIDDVSLEGSQEAAFWSLIQFLPQLLLMMG